MGHPTMNDADNASIGASPSACLETKYTVAVTNKLTTTNFRADTATPRNIRVDTLPCLA